LVYLENVTIDGTRYENVMENVMKSDENVIDENVIDGSVIDENVIDENVTDENGTDENA
jgi:hypothetical protein